MLTVAHAVAGDGHVVGDAEHRLPAHPARGRRAVAAGAALHRAVEADRDRLLRTDDLPGVAELQPLVGALHLVPADDVLAEDAELVADAVAHPRVAEGGHRVEEAGREPAEAAVAEPGVGLELDQRVEVHPGAAEPLPRRLEQARWRSGCSPARGRAGTRRTGSRRASAPARGRCALSPPSARRAGRAPPWRAPGTCPRASRGRGLGRGCTARARGRSAAARAGRSGGAGPPAAWPVRRGRGERGCRTSAKGSLAAPGLTGPEAREDRRDGLGSPGPDAVRLATVQATT